MKFRDSYRAQYYLAVLEREIFKLHSIFQQTSFLDRDFSSIVEEFSIELAEELDQILLPTVVYELHASKQVGLLKGETSFERYCSFFLENQEYTPAARDVVEKYPFLFAMTI